MSYEISCFGDLRIAKGDLDDLKRAVEKSYDQHITCSAMQTCLTLMNGLGFVNYDEGDAIRFTRPRQDVGEVSQWLPVLAPFLEGQHVSWMGEEGEVWLDEFRDGKVETTWCADLDDALLDLARLKRSYALARD